jgi:hypothetical protein
MRAEPAAARHTGYLRRRNQAETVISECLLYEKVVKLALP